MAQFPDFQIWATSKADVNADYHEDGLSRGIANTHGTNVFHNITSFRQDSESSREEDRPIVEVGTIIAQASMDHVLTFWVRYG